MHEYLCLIIAGIRIYIHNLWFTSTFHVLHQQFMFLYQPTYVLHPQSIFYIHRKRWRVNWRLKRKKTQQKERKSSKSSLAHSHLVKKDFQPKLGCFSTCRFIRRSDPTSAHRAASSSRQKTAWEVTTVSSTQMPTFESSAIHADYPSPESHHSRDTTKQLISKSGKKSSKYHQKWK